MNRVALFAIGIVLLHAPIASAQTAQPNPSEKSATTARLLGIIPGVGHMYAGEPGHGIAYMAGTAGLFTLALGVATTKCLDDALNSGECKSDTASNVLAVASLGLWAWSIYDAGRAAHRTNERRQAKKTSMIVEPGAFVRSANPGQTLRLGFSIGM